MPGWKHVGLETISRHLNQRPKLKFESGGKVGLSAATKCHRQGRAQDGLTQLCWVLGQLGADVAMLQFSELVKAAIASLNATASTLPRGSVPPASRW
jgi:hypothetical protein